MKKIIVIIVFLFTTISLVAQANRERIKALKRAHITSTLNLTSSEAEKFWPIYNTYEEKTYQLKVVKTRQMIRKLRLSGGLKNLSEKDADALLNEFLAIDSKVVNEKKKLYKNLTGIISQKKMIKLLRTERNFNKELLKRLREKKLKRR